MTETRGRTLPVDPRLVQLGEAFTPAAPIHDADLFSGRNDLLLRIADAVSQQGMHCILFGSAGLERRRWLISCLHFWRLPGRNWLRPALTATQPTITAT